MTWLTDTEWEKVQRVIPIVVVDVVALERSEDGRRVGLIRRETPHQGVRWNLIGGRVRYGETLGAAIRREVTGALGDEARVVVDEVEQPHFVALYGPFPHPSFAHDPRKHAVGLTYALPVHGRVAPRSEALGFEWFDPKALPPRSEWGFEQDRVAEACLGRVGIGSGFSGERPRAPVAHEA